MDKSGVWIEWLILADCAQVVSNKLYLLGGGWDVLTVNTSFPVEQQPLAVSVSIRVPWNETNQRHALELEIATEDGASLAKLTGQFEVGRPPGVVPGQDQRVQIAFNGAVKIEKPGGFVIIGRVDGQEDRRVFFRVVPGPGVKLKAA
jgi:hypothetical protein